MRNKCPEPVQPSPDDDPRSEPDTRVKTNQSKVRSLRDVTPGASSSVSFDDAQLPNPVAHTFQLQEQLYRAMWCDGGLASAHNRSTGTKVYDNRGDLTVEVITAFDSGEPEIVVTRQSDAKTLVLMPMECEPASGLPAHLTLVVDQRCTCRPHELFELMDSLLIAYRGVAGTSN